MSTASPGSTDPRPPGASPRPPAARGTDGPAAPASISVDVWSDLACPWCYIGKRRLEKAVSSGPSEVSLRFHSYELAPQAQPDREAREIDVLTEKMGSRESAEQMLAQVTEVAAREGLVYRFEDVRPANTFDAHRLIHHAAADGRGTPMVERLFAAHFTEGAALDDRAVLVALAREVGLEESETDRILADGSFGSDVRADEQAAGQIGAQGVPFFVIDQRYAISGAQPVEVFAEGLRRAAEDRVASDAATGDGSAAHDGVVSGAARNDPVTTGGGA